MLQVIALTVFPLAMITAAMSDVFTMTVPNKLTLGLALAALPVGLLAGLPAQDLLIHLASGLAVLALTFSLFALGWIGGGDAKLAAATALWLGFGSLTEYALLASIYGGMLTLALLSFRNIPLPAFALGWDWLTRLHNKETGVPYGIALAAAGLMAYPSSPLWKAAL